jgi:apolipoprotein D and lipocalin family protein
MGILCGKEGPFPIEHVDLQRYSGKWFQIAATKTFYNTKEYTDVTAEYELVSTSNPEAPSALKVTNTAQTPRGTLSITGIALPDRFSSGCLLVKFDATPQFKQMSSSPAEYWILELDTKNYSYALVGTPTRQSAYILSRTPTLSNKIRQQLEESLVYKHGYGASDVRPPNWLRTKHTQTVVV